LVSATGKFGTPPRRFPRKLVDERLNVTVERDGQTLSVAGRCTTLGQGGLGAILAGELKLGDTAVVALKLAPLGEPLHLPVRLVNKHGFKHGFEFVELTAAQRRAIRQLLRLPENEP
jgi:PilZ domain-containing protein